MILSCVVPFERKKKKIPDLSLPPCIARAAFAFPLRKQLKELGPKYGLWYFPFLSILHQ
jgi:hypothetical protein